MKALQPSVREKKRYICFETDNVEKNVEKILSRVELWIGQKAYKLGRVQFMKTVSTKRFGVIVCNHKVYADTKAAITLVDFPVRIIRCSGSLKKIKETIKDGTTKSSNDGI